MRIINNFTNFYSSDIIVFNGVVTIFHFVKYLVQEDDLIRLANEEEKKYYLEVNK